MVQSPLIPRFQRHTRHLLDLRRLGSDPKALNISKVVLNEDFWNIIVKKTNRCSRQMIEKDFVKEKETKGGFL